METYLTTLNDFIEEMVELKYPRVYYLEEFKDEPFEFDEKVIMEFKDGPMELSKLELREDGTLLGKDKEKEAYVMCENVLKIIQENGKAKGFESLRKKEGIHTKVTARLSASIKKDGERTWAGVTLPIFEGFLRTQEEAAHAREEIVKISDGYMKELKDRLTSRGTSIRKGFVKL